MVSHPHKEGSGFLPLHGNVEFVVEEKEPCTFPASKAWAKHAMLHFKKSGCSSTRSKLLQHYMVDFVRPIARNLASTLPRCVDADDLEQCAFLALHDTIDKYDLTKNVCFEAFARLRVVGAMLDQLRRDDPVPRLARARTKILEQERMSFKKEFGRSPAEDELRVRLGMDDVEFGTLYRDGHAPSTICIQTTDFGEDSEFAPIHYIGHDVQTHIVEQQDLHRWICKCLDKRDKIILTLYYYESLSMREIGQSLGCSESRVSQRLQHIYKSLRFWFAEHPEELSLMAG